MEDFDLATIAITGVAPHGKSGAHWSLTLRIVPVPAADPSHGKDTERERPVRPELKRARGWSTSSMPHTVPDRQQGGAPAVRPRSPAGRDAEDRRHAAAVYQQRLARQTSDVINAMSSSIGNAHAFDAEAVQGTNAMLGLATLGVQLQSVRPPVTKLSGTPSMIQLLDSAQEASAAADKALKRH